MKSLSLLADEILGNVSSDAVIKTAASKTELKTETGAMLFKLAQVLRAESSNKVSYDDLSRFRKTHGI